MSKKDLGDFFLHHLSFILHLDGRRENIPFTRFCILNFTIYNIIPYLYFGLDNLKYIILLLYNIKQKIQLMQNLNNHKFKNTNMGSRMRVQEEAARKLSLIYYLDRAESNYWNIQISLILIGRASSCTSMPSSTTSIDYQFF